MGAHSSSAGPGDLTLGLGEKGVPRNPNLECGCGDYTMKATTDGETKPGRWVISDSWALLNHALLSIFSPLGPLPVISRQSSILRPLVW